ncbi:MAG: class III poly(R)-hydroxyalkanoic acid synthase subunit PhaE [Lamprobacter sp.]|uniref:class III poly(R)-hydroxyalkanoic acid synthase subunit PhaE n=1 Tax=Lamprobacter sp. TaxID=3100796 RepID=UPI002B25667D|nr:class III poly(R)-hydroxyalkanoic acid synthase subunit PhaE [Lamprobacter sp.]MEA3639305.1 class III poly(R)-hydroxyalkanoic acid synthase subunit PhaE [Lamprobacter sp.]
MTQNAFFDDSWLKLQRDYWDGLAKMGRQAMGVESSSPASNSASAPWLAAMEQWRKALAPAASDPARDFMQRLMDQGQAYFSLAEQFTKGLSDTGLGQGGDSSRAWDWLNQTIEQMQKGFSGLGADQDESLRRMLGFWEMPLDNWQRMMSSLSPMMPGDLLRNMPHGMMRGPMQEGLEKMLSAPGLGYSREEQAQYQDLMRAGIDYQRAFQDYSSFFNQLGIKALYRLRDLLQQKSEAGETIDSARGLYDTWVGCCEAVYADEVITPDYSRVHGRLINAQMALKQRLSVMVDESLGAMNMPTRGELRTLQDRLQETRRENKQLRQQLDQIQRRLATLPAGTPAGSEASTNASTGGSTSSGTTTGATKKTSARKKTVAKPITQSDAN